MKPILIYLLFLLSSLSFFQCTNGEEPAPSFHEYRFYKTIRIDGRDRTYLLNLPPDYYTASGDFALIIGLHGTGGNAYQFEESYAFSKMANEKHFIAVYPEGVRSTGRLGVRTWNAGGCCEYASDNNIDDVKFVRELIRFLEANYNVNPKQVYAAGMSNGGMMAYRLAAELSDQVAAIAVVSGTMVTTQPFNPSRPVPVLHMHSVNDEIIPYLGGAGIGSHYFPPVDSGLTVCASVYECTTGPQVLVDDDNYKLTTWSNCEDDVTIEYYLTKDGGHAWPGGKKPRAQADEPSHVIDANDLIWDFFQNYKLP